MPSKVSLASIDHRTEAAAKLYEAGRRLMEAAATLRAAGLREKAVEVEDLMHAAYAAGFDIDPRKGG